MVPSGPQVTAIRGVAGVQTPAFVERTAWYRGTGYSLQVSPGFRLRPSLSAGPIQVQDRIDLTAVSPGFRLRPSLSGLTRWWETFSA